MEVNSVGTPEIAEPCYGYRRLCALLERSGCPDSAQRVYRIYTEEQLAVRRLNGSGWLGRRRKARYCTGPIRNGIEAIATLTIAFAALCLP